MIEGRVLEERGRERVDGGTSSDESGRVEACLCVEFTGSNLDGRSLDGRKSKDETKGEKKF